MHSVTSSLPDEKNMHWTQILLILRVILPLKHLKDIHDAEIVLPTTGKKHNQFLRFLLKLKRKQEYISTVDLQ